MMILFLMQTTAANVSMFDFLSEPLGVLIFAAMLIGGAVGLRRFLKWNESMAQRARDLSQELLEKTVG